MVVGYNLDDRRLDINSDRKCKSRHEFPKNPSMSAHNKWYHVHETRNTDSPKSIDAASQRLGQKCCDTVNHRAGPADEEQSKAKSDQADQMRLVYER